MYRERIEKEQQKLRDKEAKRLKRIAEGRESDDEDDEEEEEEEEEDKDDDEQDDDSDQDKQNSKLNKNKIEKKEEEEVRVIIKPFLELQISDIIAIEISPLANFILINYKTKVIGLRITPNEDLALLTLPIYMIKNLSIYNPTKKE